MTIITRVSSGCQDQLGNKFVGGGHKSTNQLDMTQNTTQKSHVHNVTTTNNNNNIQVCDGHKEEEEGGGG